MSSAEQPSVEKWNEIMRTNHNAKSDVVLEYNSHGNVNGDIDDANYGDHLINEVVTASTPTIPTKE